MSTSVEIKSLQPWHEALLEYIIANPRASGAEIAFHFEVTEAWVSTVKNSDAFQELWASRRGEHFSRVSSNIVEKVTALAEMTVDALTDKVEQEKNEGKVSIQTLTEVGQMALRSLGFGVSKSQTIIAPSVNQTNNNVFIDKDTLARAREARAKMQEQLPSSSSEEMIRTIEHNSVENEREF